MKKPIKAAAFLSILLLTGCFHSPNGASQNYCQQLKTQINTFPPTNLGQPRLNNAANRSVLLQQYNQLDCGSLD